MQQVLERVKHCSETVLERDYNIIFQILYDLNVINKYTMSSQDNGVLVMCSVQGGWPYCRLVKRTSRNAAAERTAAAGLVVRVPIKELS